MVLTQSFKVQVAVFSINTSEVSSIEDAHFIDTDLIDISLDRFRNIFFTGSDYVFDVDSNIEHPEIQFNNMQVNKYPLNIPHEVLKLYSKELEIDNMLCMDPCSILEITSQLSLLKSISSGCKHLICSSKFDDIINQIYYESVRFSNNRQLTDTTHKFIISIRFTNIGDVNDVYLRINYAVKFECSSPAMHDVYKLVGVPSYENADEFFENVIDFYTSFSNNLPGGQITTINDVGNKLNKTSNHAIVGNTGNFTLKDILAVDGNGNNIIIENLLTDTQLNGSLNNPNNPNGLISIGEGYILTLFIYYSRDKDPNHIDVIKTWQDLINFFADDQSQQKDNIIYEKLTDHIAINADRVPHLQNFKTELEEVAEDIKCYYCAAFYYGALNEEAQLKSIYNALHDIIIPRLCRI